MSKSRKSSRSKLRNQIEVFNQDVNLNDPAVRSRLDRAGLLDDAIKLANVDTVTKCLHQICVELKELASEAAQPGVSLARRVILQSKADALTDEYNGLVAKTDFTVTERIGQKLDRLGFHVH